jgi:F0F1-type ATP synthase assembly protein I
MNSPGSQPPKRNAAFLQQMSLAMELPFVMVGGVLIGGGLGYLADRGMHSSPTFTLIGGFLGFGLGLWDILRLLSRNRNRARGGPNA